MELTQKRLKELLNYDAETGVFTRRLVLGSRAKIGDTVGYGDGKGYLQTRIGGKNYRMHRLAWFWVHGVWPEHEIDHYDRVRSNNRLTNLRSATRSENCHNISLGSHNTSGYIGVSWSEIMAKWEARITKDNKSKVLGYFKTPKLASAAYQTAKLTYHPTAPQK